ncbi:hypothetical protein SAMN05892883_0850 [Jatrophihabitans sp. GAS493]|uniref:hypothetical protein n=1 Tax=Jatrophihabitans sp. GAS493 TaxID=1907575 RepID=UPI000BB9637E|nr:hypothetical protein [Jatrophihabitans sp. GAS493]SOD71311.1 hypothetical protein SAMN05892883_0850 [Jatrophihabitans sp. GAS493]
MSATLYSEGSDLNAVIAEIGQRHAGAATVVSLEEHRQGGVLGFFARKAYGITYEVDDAVDVETVDELAETVTVTAGPATANSAGNTASNLDELLDIAEQTERSLAAARRPAALAAPAQSSIGTSLPVTEAQSESATSDDEPDFAATLQAIAAAREAARESSRESTRDGRRPRHYAPEEAPETTPEEAPIEMTVDTTAELETVGTNPAATTPADTGISAESAQWIAQQAEAKRVEAMLIQAQRAQAERAEAQRVEAARIEAARIEAARIEAARIEAARVEAARVEAARIEAARVEAERVAAERVAAERSAAERSAAERSAAEQREAEQRAAEQREALRIAAEKLAAEKLAAEAAAARKAAEAAAQEAADHAAAELFQRQLHEAALIEADRVEASRIEAERIEADRAAAARLAAQQLENERIAATQRAEAERIEAARINAARIELARNEKLRSAAEAAAKSAPAFEPLHPRVAPATAQIIPAIGAEPTAIPEPVAAFTEDEKVSEPQMGKHEKKKGGGKKSKALRRGAAIMQASQYLGSPSAAAPVEPPIPAIPAIPATVDTTTVTDFIEPDIIEIAEEQVPAEMLSTENTLAESITADSTTADSTMADSTMADTAECVIEIEADVVAEVDTVVKVEVEQEIIAEEVPAETVADVVAEVDVVNGTVIDITRSSDLRHAAPEPETESESDPTEAPAPEVIPISDDFGDDTTSQLRELGVPVEMLTTAKGQDIYRTVRQLSLALPAAPNPPSGAGEILVLVGPLIATLRAGRALATELRLPAESLRVVTTNPDFPLKQSAGSVAQAALAAATIRVSGGVGIIVVDTELDDAPMLVTANGATTPANVVGEVLAAIAPTTVWAVTDASRKTADIRNWLAGMPAVQALVVHDAWKSSTPATVWSLGVPVALLDGRPASAGAWSALLIDRIERDITRDDVAASA